MSVVKGAVAGLAGGVAGAFAMNLFQRATAAAGQGREAAGAAPGSPREGRGPQPAQAEGHASDDAAARSAAAVAEPVLGRPLTREERKVGGSVMHVAFGGSAGLAYGIAAEMWPTTTSGAGVPYAMAVWAGADEGVVPALGLSRGPRELPSSVLAYGAASHVVFGLTMEVVRRLVRGALGDDAERDGRTRQPRRPAHW